MIQKVQLKELPRANFPKRLTEIADPPKKLFVRGDMPPEDYKYLCVVGARKFSDYGKQAVEKLIAGLRGYPIVIVSGLALGIDSIAHRAAILAGFSETRCSKS